MFTTKVLLAAFVAAVSAAPACKPVPTYILPSSATNLTQPADGMTLKKIAVGHGIQNYSCATTDAAVTQLGALAVLYDVTPLYPGTANTGLNQSAWDALTANILWNTDIPLNLVNETAKCPGTITNPNALPETMYAADMANPFPAPADLTNAGLQTLKFLGHHFFNSAGVPTFDLSAAGLFGSVSKNGSVNAPAGADAGILGTGAVAWIYLVDNGASSGIGAVYRVITAGGAAQACSKAGVGAGSVPYTALYWFYA